MKESQYTSSFEKLKPTEEFCPEGGRWEGGLQTGESGVEGRKDRCDGEVTDHGRGVLLRKQVSRLPQNLMLHSDPIICRAM
jgi:hypothetical protein